MWALSEGASRYREYERRVWQRERVEKKYNCAGGDPLRAKGEKMV
jgi:hypothetical protein